MKRPLQLLLSAGLAALGFAWAAPALPTLGVEVVGRRALFDFAALTPGPNASLAASLGGVASNSTYRSFLAANVDRFDFVATDLGVWPMSLPQGALDAIGALNPDGLLNVKAPAGQTWRLVAKLAAPMPSGYGVTLRVISSGQAGSSWLTSLSNVGFSTVAAGSGDGWFGLQYHLVVSRFGAAGAVSTPDLQVNFDIQPTP